MPQAASPRLALIPQPPIQVVASIQALLSGATKGLGCREAKSFAPRNTESTLLPSQLRDLLKWGVIEKTANPGMTGRLFLTPKSNGTQARALFDARPQNALLDWCALSSHGRFRLLRPFHQILVGLAVRAKRPVLAELDFTSFFFQFSWSPALATAHAFRFRNQAYACRAPVQGSAVMPLVAQTASAILAEAPSVRAGPWDWVRCSISIIYDNILLSGEEEDVTGRWARLKARCAAARVVMGDAQPPCSQLTSCCRREERMTRQ